MSRYSVFAFRVSSRRGEYGGVLVPLCSSPVGLQRFGMFGHVRTNGRRTPTIVGAVATADSVAEAAANAAVPADVPADAPADAPADTSADAPADAPAGGSSRVLQFDHLELDTADAWPMAKGSAQLPDHTQSAGVLPWIRQKGAQLSVAGLIFLVLTFTHAFALLVFKLNTVDGSYPFSSASTVVVTEAVKLCLAAALHRREIRLQPAATRPSGLVESFRRTASRWLVLETCIVSAMYTGNNLLSYYCVAQMDPGTLAIAKSLVPYLTAIVLQLFGRTVNGLQWACVILQCTGVATTQYVDHDGSEGLYSWSSYAWLALSVAITTASSVCNERVVRRSCAPLQQINMIMYSCGIALATTVYVAVPAYHEKTFFEGYSPMVALLIFVQATYGLCVGYAYKCVSLYELPPNRASPIRLPLCLQVRGCAD